MLRDVDYLNQCLTLSVIARISYFSPLLSSSWPWSECPATLLQHQRTFIQMRTVLKVVDNSGAKKVMCIQPLKGRKGARLGDTIIASVKEAAPNGKVKKGAVVRGVVVRAAMQRGRCDGSEVKFDDNAVVIIDKQGQPVGSRVFGPVPHELRKKKHVKILALAEHIAWGMVYFGFYVLDIW